LAVALIVRMRFPILFAALLAACTSTVDGADQSGQGDDTVGVPSAGDTIPYVSASALSNDAVPAQSNVFHIVFALVPNEPSGAAIDAVVGLSDGPASDFADLGPTVRFSPAGTLDVRNGSAYAADLAFPYTAGETYQIRMDVDLGRHLYSVLVQENGGHTTQLARNYAFRTEQATVAKLDNAARIVDSATGTLDKIAIDVTAQQ
jgi:hypothetical protein